VRLAVQAPPLDCGGDERKEEINTPQLGNKEISNFIGSMLAQIEGVSDGKSDCEFHQ
jgi:hypothetical protein